MWAPASGKAGRRKYEPATRPSSRRATWTVVMPVSQAARNWARSTGGRRGYEPPATPAAANAAKTASSSAAAQSSIVTRARVRARCGLARSHAGALGRLEALELGGALLRQRHVDRVEVARDDGAREHRARLVADLAAAVAGGDVGQREQPDVGLAGDLGRLAGGAVAGLERAVSRLLGERRLVDEHVGADRGGADHVARRGVAGDDDGAAGARRPDDLLGADAVAALAALQAPEVGPERHPARRGELGVEAPGALVLDDGVAEGLQPVADVERADLVAVVAHGLAGLELDDAERIAQAPVDELHRAHELGRAGRAVDGEGRVAVAQVEGLEHAGQPEPVVGVQVGEVAGLDVGQADGAQELALGALAAVEQ